MGIFDRIGKRFETKKDEKMAEQLEDEKKKRVIVELELPKKAEVDDYDTKEALKTLLENGFTITGHLVLEERYKNSSDKKVYFIPDSYVPKSKG